MSIALVGGSNTYNFKVQENPHHKPGSLTQRVIDAFDKTETGPYKSFQFADKLLSFISCFVGKEFCSKVSKVFSSWKATIVFRLPSVIESAASGFMGKSKLNDLPGSFRRKSISFIQEAATFTATVGYSSSLFLFAFDKTRNLGEKALLSAEVASLVNDFAELEKNAEDLLKVRQFKKLSVNTEGAEELKAALDETSKACQLRALKATCSVAGWALGIGLSAAGMASLPAVVALSSGISLVGSALGIQASLSKPEMKYKEVKFFEENSLSVSTNQPEEKVAG